MALRATPKSTTRLFLRGFIYIQDVVTEKNVYWKCSQGAASGRDQCGAGVISTRNADGKPIDAMAIGQHCHRPDKAKTEVPSN